MKAQPQTETARKLLNSRTQMERILVKDLVVHSTAQRKLVPSQYANINNNFTLAAIGVLSGVRYRFDGSKHIVEIVDGGHRLNVLKDRGYENMLVDVKIYLDITTDAESSELFLLLNNNKAVGTFALYYNALQAGHADARGAHQAALANGLRISEACGDGNVTCVNTLRRLWLIDCGPVLDAVLKTVISAWGQTAPAVEGKILSGIGFLYKRYSAEKLDRKILATKLAKYAGGPAALIGAARGLAMMKRISTAAAMTEVLIDLYDTGRRSGRLRNEQREEK